MSGEAKLRVGETGAEAAASNLDKITQAANRAGQATKSWSSQIRDFTKVWADMGDKSVQGYSKLERGAIGASKAIYELAAANAKQAAQAVMAPGMSSYGGMIEQANRYRQATTQIQIATGKTFEQIGQQVLDQSKKLGISEQRIQTYGRSVRSITGDWDGAMKGMGAFNSRALQTDRTLEEMIPVASELTTLFGVTNEKQVASFFGTLDAQAQKAQISGSRAERAYAQFAQTLAGISGSMGQRTGLALAFQTGAVNEDVGNRTFGAFMNMVRGQRYGIEAAMRAKGKLGKGEYLFDERGQFRQEKLADVADFAPGYMSKFYGAKNRMEAIEKLGRVQFGGDYEAAAQLLNIKPGDVRAMQAAQGSLADVTGQYLGTGAGRRESADAAKARADRLFGSGLLGAQDSAVAAGGGAAGLAMAQAIGTFEKASGLFWDSVKLFTSGIGGAGGAGATVAGAGGAAVGAGGVALAGAGAAGAYGLLQLENAGAVDRAQDALAFAPMREGRDPAGRAKTLRQRAWMRDNHLGFLLPEDDSDIGGGSSGGGAATQQGADMIGAAVAKHLAGATLRTQPVSTPVAPPSQGQPQ